MPPHAMDADAIQRYQAPAVGRTPQEQAALEHMLARRQAERQRQNAERDHAETEYRRQWLEEIQAGRRRLQRERRLVRREQLEVKCELETLRALEMQRQYSGSPSEPKEEKEEEEEEEEEGYGETSHECLDAAALFE
ncbi:hypothetical protein DL769_006224 [Monosporascus sp. CRB-8-3]|nr:hypothetical protein DL769_006224 [Monosporascus sp. CRB-8-3]